MTHKKKDLPVGGMYDDDPKELQRILDLEDTRFYYSFGKKKLERLLKEGRRYMEKNDISDEELEYMSWELE